MALGYRHAPELTAERFVDIDGQRVYRAGDLVRIDLSLGATPSRDDNPRGGDARKPSQADELPGNPHGH